MPAEKRDLRLVVLLTPSEADRVRGFADGYGMSMSNAGRHLIRRGLDAEQPQLPSPTEE